MADEAALISKMRYEFICRISPLVNQSLCKMTGEREQTELVYRGSVGLIGEEYLDCERIKQRYIELLSGSHDREIGAGATLWGIHKDDMEIDINGNRARIFASQGQQRSLSLALKLAEGEMIREEMGGDYPVFLFDDVLSELDGGRREYLLSNIKGKQVILTCCEKNGITSDRIIRVKDGIYVQEE
jgi:DNA replication and repair protein RecF